ncbi:MAG: hypothetical protein IPK22_05630 [Verrucomicrobiaceae bacterium]|nr:hypothetical protein [Verrucomicrobiaceae bacterium]
MNRLTGIFLALSMTALAQIATPTTPTKFGQRGISGGTNSGNAAVNVAPAASEATARITSHYSFGELRQWKSADGRSLLGKMIAFEDAVIEVKRQPAAEAQSAAMAAPAPKPPEKFTLLREGKIRLLVNNKPFEVPLDKLSAEDQAFAKQVEATVNAK